LSVFVSFPRQLILIPRSASIRYEKNKMATKIFCVLLSCACAFAAPASQSVDFLMPQVQPQEPDTYLCTSINANSLQSYITEYFPHANMEIAHHILLYGCGTPGSTNKVWNCGEMASSNDKTFEMAPVCQTGSKIIYAWAMDAPSLKLPQDVAFKIGGDSGINYLTMQVHYKNVTTFKPPQSKTDSSGLTLITTDVPRAKRAGVYLMVSGGEIPAGSIEYLEMACPYDDVEIHPFGFRTHAHTLGRVVSGYRVRDGEWTEIGRMDPKKPQMFYNVTNNVTLKKGDILAARCTMDNSLDHDVAVGNTQNDEMCNFYIMYYVDGQSQLEKDMCFKPGAPQWYLWDYPDQEALNLQAMPANASAKPGTDYIYKANSTAYLQGLNADVSEVKENEMMDEALDEILAQMNPNEVEALLASQYMNPQLEEGREGEAYPGYFYPEEFQ